jgi:hypothetical protein
VADDAEVLRTVNYIPPQTREEKIIEAAWIVWLALVWLIGPAVWLISWVAA